MSESEGEKNGLALLIPGSVSIEIQERVEAHIKVSLSHGIDEIALRRAVGMMLRAFGVNGRDVNFKETPRRVTALWKEWLKSRELALPVFPTRGKGMVTLRNHRAITVCPHHLLPVELRADVAYIPQGHVVGISKLARVVNLVAGSFMLQEHISEFVVQLLDTLLLPKGVLVRVIGQHGCMRLRGVYSEGDIVTTNMSGVYLTDEKARSEVFNSL